MVVVIQSEGLCHPSVLRTSASLGVSYISPCVFPLQGNVHYVVLLLHLRTQYSVLLCVFVEHFEVFHGEVGQVFQHDFVLSLEEILAVEGQVVNLFAVDVYVTVVFQLRSGQLADKPVEHRAFR